MSPRRAQGDPYSGFAALAYAPPWPPAPGRALNKAKTLRGRREGALGKIGADYHRQHLRRETDRNRHRKQKHRKQKRLEHRAG
jgi:hypothetical protein